MKKIEYTFRRIKKLNRGKKIGIIIGVFVLIGLILIPFSFAELTPVKSVNIYSKNSSYDDNTPGAWKIEKSGKWVSRGTAEVTFNVETKSMIKTSKTDVILVLDTSGSMEEQEIYDDHSSVDSRINILKKNCEDFLNNIFTSGDNKVALIRFSNESQILSDLTKDKDSLLRQINSFTANGETNYYSAFVDVDNMLKNYHKEADRETIVLFLTDGLPNINTPNEVAQYNYLKNQYPWLTINGIQYEMGNKILDPIKKVTDNQFIADSVVLNNALLEGSVPKLNYEEFSITDYIDTRYFSVESTNDITVNNGTVALDKDNQKVIWNLTELRSGLNLNKPEMKIKIKLKEELVGAGGVYPTNSHEVINTKIENQIENVDSNLTPILADNYKVTYDVNEPVGCSVVGAPGEESHSVFDMVDMSNNKPVCEGYKFKGWRIVDTDIKKVGSDRFIMPEKNVKVKAIWGKLYLKKSMDGTIAEMQSLYDMMKNNSISNDRNIDFYYKDLDKTSGIYQYYKTSTDEYPVYYYRGEVNNNLKYANMCWKIVRTTETGGTKLIYNGLPAGDGSCNNTGADTAIGSSMFNTSTQDNSISSLSYTSYKYGKAYNSKSRYRPSWYELVGKDDELKWNIASTNYYFSDSVTYQNGNYTLNNAKQYYWSDHYSELTHYYTCFSETNGVCDKVYFVLSGSSEDGGSSNAPSSSIFNYIEMENGETYEKFYSEAENFKWIFGNDVTYSDGKYTLVDLVEIGAFDFYNDVNEASKSNTAHHYTCFTNSNVCTGEVDYIFFNDDGIPDYIVLNNGTKIEDAVREMTSGSTNENNSTILNKLYEWYENNLKGTEFANNVEDTIWCNDRTISDFAGWDRNGNNTKLLSFGAYGRNIVYPYQPSLTCENEVDRFSTTNSKAKLDYPVGLLTADEATLAGSGWSSYSVKSYLNIGDWQWLLSPASYNDSVIFQFRIHPDGYIYNFYTYYSGCLVRPSISLKPGAIISGGDGSGNAPFEITYSGV